MIRAFEEEEPTVADSAYVDPEATVIGNVTLDAGATVLPGAVIRGDGGGEVLLCENANVQDNVTVHADAPGQEVLVGGTPAEVLQEDLDRDRALFSTAEHYTHHVEGLRVGLGETG
jgi:carbonic anhydrase/acetyltransferase-like protein (isoleucine patch superfamily)